MSQSILLVVLLIALILLPAADAAFAQDASLGVFEGHGDVGDTAKAGAVEYDAGAGRYAVTGGGENMWFEADAFHFVWKKVSGDVTLAADIDWPREGGQPHRKAVLIVRQTLEPGSKYADAAVHGDGLTSVQYRAAAGGVTREIRSNAAGPRRVRIEKRGDYITMSVAAEGEALEPAGGTMRLKFEDPFYVGLGVTAHDNAAAETAVFSNVVLEESPAQAAGEPVLHSTLEIIDAASLNRRVVHTAAEHFEAPNWTPDGRTLIFNSNGRLFKIAPTGGEPAEIDTGFARRCNNDHLVSPDGRRIAISDQTRDESKSIIYTLPITGGQPEQVTPNGPSYLHGWSPDGARLAYCAERGGNYDIYTIPVGGGEETRLTDAPGLDDGPDYSPDGRWIYFNSTRTGKMHIYRMKTDGSGQEQLTTDDRNNWFAHPSPDGKTLVYVSYEPQVEGHPMNQHVELRMIPAEGGEPKVLATLFGGQGTINVPSWSPDGSEFAFVSYQLVGAE